MQRYWLCMCMALIFKSPWLNHIQFWPSPCLTLFPRAPNSVQYDNTGSWVNYSVTKSVLQDEQCTCITGCLLHKIMSCSHLERYDLRRRRLLMDPLGRPHRLCGCTTSLWEGPGCGEGPGNSCRSTSGEATRACLLVNHCVRSSSKLGNCQSAWQSHSAVWHSAGRNEQSGHFRCVQPTVPCILQFWHLAFWAGGNRMLPCFALQSLRGGLSTGVLPLWLLPYLNIIWSRRVSLKSFSLITFNPAW